MLAYINNTAGWNSSSPWRDRARIVDENGVPRSFLLFEEETSFNFYTRPRFSLGHSSSSCSSHFNQGLFLPLAFLLDWIAVYCHVHKEPTMAVLMVSSSRGSSRHFQSARKSKTTPNSLSIVFLPLLD